MLLFFQNVFYLLLVRRILWNMYCWYFFLYSGAARKCHILLYVRPFTTEDAVLLRGYCRVARVIIMSWKLIAPPIVQGHLRALRSMRVKTIIRLFVIVVVRTLHRQSRTWDEKGRFLRFHGVFSISQMFLRARLFTFAVSRQGKIPIGI